MYLRLANVLYFELHHISLCVYNKAHKTVLLPSWCICRKCDCKKIGGKTLKNLTSVGAKATLTSCYGVFHLPVVQFVQEKIFNV